MTKGVLSLFHTIVLSNIDNIEVQNGTVENWVKLDGQAR
jgi:hypothetical protein